MKIDCPDPPMDPAVDTAFWFQSGPEAIAADLEIATLIVRVGMAYNSLAAQLQAGVDARRHRRHSAARTRGLISALVTSAAVTKEARKLAQDNKVELRRLAQDGGAKRALLDKVDNLCQPMDPAAAFLSRARNKIGFHWDPQVVRNSLRDFSKKQKIVWVEADRQWQPVHRLAVDVAAHALFREAFREAHDKPQEAEMQIRDSIEKINGAMRLLIDFFAAAFLGFAHRFGLERKEASKPRRGGRR